MVTVFEYLFTLLFIIGHWLIYTLLFALLGRSLLARRKHAETSSIFDAAWAGLFLATAALQFWHIFLPVTAWCFWIFTAVAGFAAKETFKLYSPALFQVNKFYLGTASIIALWLANQSLAPTFTYDSLAYHFATIRWNVEHPLVPGLANLYIYFGLNQSYFLLAAMIDRASAIPEGCVIFNGFLVLLLAAECLQNGAQISDSKTKFPCVSAIFLFCALPVVLKLGAFNLSSPTPDVIVNLATLRFFYCFLAISESRSYSALGVKLWLIFAASAITLKASLAGFAAAGASLLFANMRWSAASDTSQRSKMYVYGIGAFCLITLPYLVRGVIASGYPLFPSPAISFATDWRVPKTEVTRLYDYIRFYARTHEHRGSELLPFTDTPWLGNWVETCLHTAPAICLCGSLLVYSAIVLLQMIRKGASIPLPRQPAALLASAMVFWFCTAPDMRFGGYLLFAVAIWLLAQSTVILADTRGDRAMRKLISYSIACASLLIIGRYSQIFHGCPRAPIFPMTEISLAGGAHIHVLKQPADADDWRIGYASPPATALAHDDLQLRSGILRDGYRRLAPLRQE